MGTQSANSRSALHSGFSNHPETCPSVAIVIDTFVGKPDNEEVHAHEKCQTLPSDVTGCSVVTVSKKPDVQPNTYVQVRISAYHA